MRCGNTAVDRSEDTAELGEVILETVRLTGHLLSAEDRLTEDLGLTSARWQLLRAIDRQPRPVAQIARLNGQTRQAVQRIANVLVEEGFAAYAANPEHKRAKLVQLSDRGRDALDEANRRHLDWSRRLAAGFEPAPIGSALWLLQNLRRRLTTAEHFRMDGTAPTP